MLTADLVRIKVRGQSVLPGWIKPDSPVLLEKAGRILTIIGANEGATKGALDDGLEPLTGQGRDFRLMRGLAKLVLDKVAIGVVSDLEPRRVRETVFALATPHHPVTLAQRAAILREAALALDATPQEIEEALYADLAANQRVGPCPQMTAEALLHRYNLALAQAVLLKSSRLKVELLQPTPKRLRQLLRYLKFHRLTYTAERSDAGWSFRIDGPTSIVKQSSRYGLQLANFLPALLLCEDWRLDADYQRKKGTRKGVFRLTPKVGLKTHLKDTGTWVAEEELALMARLRELAAPWRVQESTDLLDLDGRGHLVPDLVVRDPDTGAKAFVEVVWRWRKSALKARWKLLRKAGPKNLVLAVCAAGAADEVPDLPGPVHVFKGIPNVRSIWKLARKVAR